MLSPTSSPASIGLSIKKSNVVMEPSWLAKLSDEFEKPYMKDLKSFLQREYASLKTIYPKKDEYFAAFAETPFDKVKVVILGQDPYHGPGQAHGLSFSVKPGVPLPPSLLNIYKELFSDLGIPLTRNGYLAPWAKQGVLLLNSVLTVEAGMAASHQGKGWERFTDRVIELLATEREQLVFVLWGSYAQKKGAFIDRSKHLVISTAHPSPLSAHRGFFGSRVFSQINQYLQKNCKQPIDWKLPAISY